MEVFSNIAMNWHLCQIWIYVYRISILCELLNFEWSVLIAWYSPLLAGENPWYRRYVSEHGDSERIDNYSGAYSRIQTLSYNCTLVNFEPSIFNSWYFHRWSDETFSVVCKCIFIKDSLKNQIIEDQLQSFERSIFIARYFLDGVMKSVLQCVSVYLPNIFCKNLQVKSSCWILRWYTSFYQWHAQGHRPCLLNSYYPLSSHRRQRRSNLHEN